MDIIYSNLIKLKNILRLRYIFFILISITSLIQIILIFKNSQLEKIEEKRIINQSDKIENCIDIENKNKRTIYENLKLSEYCINKFGTITR